MSFARYPLGLAATAALLLGACADPGVSARDAANRDATLNNLIQNSVSDAYGQCLSDLRTELAALQLQSRQLDAESLRLNAEAASLDGERRASTERLAQLNASQAELMRRIGTEGQDTRTDDAQVQGLLDSEQALRDEIDAQTRSGEVDAATANRLIQRQQALNALALQVL